MATALRFKSTNNVEFTKALRKRIKDYFAETNQSVNANWKMWVKIVVLINLWVGALVVLLLNVLPLWAQYLDWAFLGFMISMVCINVGHDAIHGAVSKHKWVNDLLSHTFNLNGASAYMWRNMHNIAHHTYTNVDGYDEDIAPVPIIRLSPGAELKPIHKHQHWYAFLFYGLATISWVFMKDYKKFFENTVGNYTGRKHPRREYFFLFLYKALNYAIFIGLPFIFIEQPWYLILPGYLLMHLVSGLHLAIVFMMAHAVEHVEFPLPDNSGNLENDYFVHQICTTVNFSTGKFWPGLLSGGLNQQIEHHLFPNICTIHYPAMAKIVQQTTKEYGIPYNDIPTFWGAVKSHVRFLYRLGREPQRMAA
jgi:linoleoyl-CoA desaturase